MTFNWERFQFFIRDFWDIAEIPITIKPPPPHLNKHRKSILKPMIEKIDKIE